MSRLIHSSFLAMVMISVFGLGCGQVPRSYFERFIQKPGPVGGKIDSSLTERVVSSQTLKNSTWTAQCHIFNYETSTTAYAIETLKITDSMLMLNEVSVYSDSSCLRKIYTLDLSGSVAVNTASQGGYFIQNFSNAAFSPFTNDEAALFTARHQCGATDAWTAQEDPRVFSVILNGNCMLPVTWTSLIRFYRNDEYSKAQLKVEPGCHANSGDLSVFDCDVVFDQKF